MDMDAANNCDLENEFPNLECPQQQHPPCNYKLLCKHGEDCQYKASAIPCSPTSNVQPHYDDYFETHCGYYDPDFDGCHNNN